MNALLHWISENQYLIFEYLNFVPSYICKDKAVLSTFHESVQQKYLLDVPRF